MELKGAFDATKSIAFSASRSTILSITIILPGSACDYRPPYVEVLFGRPFLKAFGFCLQQHLQSVRNIVHNRGISKLSLETAKICASTYSVMAYNSSNHDRIELPQPLAAGSAEDIKESIDNAFGKIREESKKTAFSWMVSSHVEISATPFALSSERTRLPTWKLLILHVPKVHVHFALHNVSTHRNNATL